jgi:hypothetical protein
MQISVKNIVLYEPLGGVAGYCELRSEKDKTHIKLKQNFNADGLLLSVTADGQTEIIKISGEITECDIGRKINSEREVFVCIIQLKGGKPQTAASGVINLNKLKAVFPQQANGTENLNKLKDDKNVKSKAVKEIDKALKSACEIGGCGNGECHKCPYREYFFGETDISEA